MNDRFKFRVFILDKKNSKNSLTGMFKVHSLHTGTNKAIITSLYGNCSIKLENNILMQCTGLKDKNGKLIFEGDVIRYYFDDDSEDFIVKYSEKDLAFITETLDGKYQNNFIDYDIIPTKEYEIIGNIFENPLDTTKN